MTAKVHHTFPRYNHSLISCVCSMGSYELLGTLYGGPDYVRWFYMWKLVGLTRYYFTCKNKSCYIISLSSQVRLRPGTIYLN
jgi:hypothetical protein